MTYVIVQGTTASLRFQLLEAGSPIDLIGSAVTLLLADKTGTTLVSPGIVTVTEAATGKVEFAPTDATVFDPELGPYLARWKIIDGSAKISYVPSGARDVWNIIGV